MLCSQRQNRLFVQTIPLGTMAYRFRICSTSSCGELSRPSRNVVTISAGSSRRHAGIDETAEAIKTMPLVSRLRGGERVEVMPQATRPRFSVRVPDPAFSAAHAGSLAVVPDASYADGVRLVSPTGTAVGTIVNSPADPLRVGQRGQLYLDDDHSVFSRLWAWMTNQS